MNRLLRVRYLLQTVLLIVVCGCAYPISSEMRASANPDLTCSVVARDPISYKGATIIWGGIIIQVRNQPGQTMLTILDTPLDEWEVPKDEIHGRGRFIAQANEYLDPDVYGSGRKVVLAGEIVGEETKPLDDRQYHFPVVQVRELHLFHQRDDFPRYRPGDYQDRYRYPDNDRSPFKGIQ